MSGVVQSLKSWVARKIRLWMEQERVKERSDDAREMQQQIREQLYMHFKSREEETMRQHANRIHEAYKGQTSRLTTLLAEKELEINELKASQGTKKSRKAPKQSAQRSRRKRVSRA
jgi:1,6-anhydro-N-acetylmuramate kinase